jgi:hypothetical protein
MIKKTQWSVSLWYITAWVEVKIEYISIEAYNPWPTIYIQWWMHGWELTYPIIKRLLDYMQNSLLCGKIIIVPIANPLSWMQRVHYTTIGKYDFYDGKDWNRNFPWDSNGSLGQRVAAVLASLSESAEYIIDLHTSRKSIPFAILCETPIKNEMIDIFSCDLIQVIKQNDADFTGYTTGLWKKSICIECWSHDSINIDHNDYVINMLLRGLSKLWMIQEPIKLKATRSAMIFEELIDLKSTQWWYIQYNKHPWEKFIKDDLLYTLIPYALELDSLDIVAEQDWIVLKVSPTNILRNWDSVMQIIDTSKILSY